MPWNSEYEIEPTQIELEAKIGAGCTAEVFVGKWRGTQVAVKQIDWNKSHMGEKEQMAFDREVAIMPLVEHDNLVKFLGVSSLNRPFRIVTEFCAGGCCFELLHNSDHVELDWWQTKKMCMDVVLAMEYLHKFTPQIIHRDLKSLNLLLKSPVLGSESMPFVKVSDFGLSRMQDQTAEGGGGLWGKMTIAAGTCHWMAPEVFSGTTYDEKVDVYSFGMILFEMICREIPFEDEEPARVGVLACRGARPDMEAVPPDCPVIMCDLMTACWAAEPRGRPSFAFCVNALSQCQVATPNGR
jgi:serine/threonine protein kinase